MQTSPFMKKVYNRAFMTTLTCVGVKAVCLRLTSCKTVNTILLETLNLFERCKPIQAPSVSQSLIFLYLVVIMLIKDGKLKAYLHDTTFPYDCICRLCSLMYLLTKVPRTIAYTRMIIYIRKPKVTRHML